MSDIESDLENELRALRPALPSTSLAAGIERELRVPSNPARPARWPRTARLSLWASWSLTAAAATVALMAWWPATMASAPDSIPPAASLTGDTVAGERIVPVSTSNVLTDAQDEGIVVLDDGRPARRMRLHFVETVRLRDDGAQADIAVSRPREEVRFVPVSLY